MATLMPRFIKSANGTSRHKVTTTTRSRKPHVQWRDSSSIWTDINELKDFNPIDRFSEYAVANRIKNETVFAWWRPEVLRRRNRIIGIRLPKSIEEALRIEKETDAYYYARRSTREWLRIKEA